MSSKRVLILGASGRVGLHIAAELCRAGLDLVLVDIVDDALLRQKMGRITLDTHINAGRCDNRIVTYGGVSALDQNAVAAILHREQPDLVINYAIPITWDATKRLPNYSAVSAAGLGAFTPIQVLAPLTVSRAIVDAELDAGLIVGNLPDITAPIIAAEARTGRARAPLCGAGNVGLIQAAIRSQVARDLGKPTRDIDVDLVAHHVHWVAPREPGYSNAGPFHLRVTSGGEAMSAHYDDPRALMNLAIRNHYEADASFSSTTGYLAAQLAMALLDDSGTAYDLHAPAPNGLPGGYPVRIVRGAIAPRLPASWDLTELQAAMEVCHTHDGVSEIRGDGTVRFSSDARDILREELAFDLPAQMTIAEIEDVAQMQIAALRAAFRKLS